MNLLPPTVTPAAADTLEPRLLQELPLAGSGRQRLHGWRHENKPGELESSDSSGGVWVPQGGCSCRRWCYAHPPARRLPPRPPPHRKRGSQWNKGKDENGV